MPGICLSSGFIEGAQKEQENGWVPALFRAKVDGLWERQESPFLQDAG